MIYPKIPLAQTVVQLCKLKNIEHIVISPGSRNAPLVIGFTNDNFFTCYSIVDERCAAFFALGIAQQIQNPVALVCTSGSALLNYYPAIAEAFFSDIPLVVLSADRPKHLISIGDGQTINQKDVYASHIEYSANLKLDIDIESSTVEDELPIFKNIENKLEKLLGLQNTIQQDNELEINKAINEAVFKNGPVHINVPFNEPLYETSNELVVNCKVIEVKQKIAKTKPEEFQQLLDIWNLAERKLILVGANFPNTINQNYLDQLAKNDSIIVLTETTSNLNNDSFFPSIDKLIAPLNDSELKGLQPDILLTFGGLIVSKKVKAFLRTYKPKAHWHIDEKKANDTFFSLTKHLRTNPNIFFEQILPKTNSLGSNYLRNWTLVKQKRQQKHDAYLQQLEFSDLKVFDILLKEIPNNTILHLGNSSTIRYAQLFNLNKTLQVFCNRGTSGIDGCTSTAIGCSVISEKQITLISGDLSFFYDSNALWNNYIPSNFRIIVINNSGGGIFRILPGHKNSENFDTFFETKHKLTAKQLCEMYNFEYAMASNKNELEYNLNTFYKDSSKPKLLEIFTPRTKNDEALLSYFDFLK